MRPVQNAGTPADCMLPSGTTGEQELVAPTCARKCAVVAQGAKRSPQSLWIKPRPKATHPDPEHAAGDLEPLRDDRDRKSLAAKVEHLLGKALEFTVTEYERERAGGLHRVAFSVRHRSDFSHWHLIGTN